MSKNNIDIYDMMPSIQKLIEENENLKKENQELKEQVDYYKKEMESEQCFRENLQIDLIEFVGAIKILKEFVTITKGKNEETKKWDIPIIYSLGLNKKISQKQYELLEQVFESVGDSDE